MSTVDKDIEKLIIRHLDGELSAEEELELNRELIRNREARRMMEDYQRIDGLAETALDQVIGNEGVKFDPTALTTVSSRRRHAGYYRVWWLVPGAVAAALLALVIPQYSPRPVDQTSPKVVEQSPLPHNAPTPLQQRGAERYMHPVSTGPRIKRSTGRDVFGVVGDDGNFYWIEVDRVRTLKRASPQPAGRLQYEAM